MSFRGVFRVLQVVGTAVLCAIPLLAQNPIQLFSPVNVRLSQSGAGNGPSRVIFNSSTLNFSCPASPSAVLSSSPNPNAANGSGNVLVDNDINVSTLRRAPCL